MLQVPRLVAYATIAPSRFVIIDAHDDNLAAQCGANGFAIGISHEGQKSVPGVTGSDAAIHAEAGDLVGLYGMGEMALLLAGSGGWTAGDPIISDANGKGVTGNASSDVICAYALTDCAAGALGLVYKVSPCGFPQSTGSLVITSTSASALTVGANGATNPVLKIDANTASVATGVTVVGAAAAGGVAIAAISSGTNEAMSIDAKGSGLLKLALNSTGGITIGGATEAVTIKSAKVSGTIAVAVPSITDPDIAKVDVDLSGMTFAPAVGDAVIAIPLEALPTGARLQGAWVSAIDTVQLTFGSEGGNVTGANKNFKFFLLDLT